MMGPSRPTAANHVRPKAPSNTEPQALASGPCASTATLAEAFPDRGRGADCTKMVPPEGTKTAFPAFVVSPECDAGVNECERVNFVRWDRSTGEGRPNDYSLGAANLPA